MKKIMYDFRTEDMNKIDGLALDCGTSIFNALDFDLRQVIDI